VQRRHGDGEPFTSGYSRKMEVLSGESGHVHISLKPLQQSRGAGAGGGRPGGGAAETPTGGGGAGGGAAETPTGRGGAGAGGAEEKEGGEAASPAGRRASEEGGGATTGQRGGEQCSELL